MIYDPADLARAVTLLREDGFFTDEDVFGSYAVEHDTDDLVQQIKEAGFDGEDLKLGGAAPTGSAVYWLCDPRVIDEQDARREAVARHLALKASLL
ncbi:hypothetical protein [Bosea sp. ASV33]|uniref:hypothetical protein n=1 Tax=Bosea sp. ASV33 TaxID=2795106 RepID=UPI0018EAA89E|nr:hypothetical protein [Bosea sp. ASV33]